MAISGDMVGAMSPNHPQLYMDPSQVNNALMMQQRGYYPNTIASKLSSLSDPINPIGQTTDNLLQAHAAYNSGVKQ